MNRSDVASVTIAVDDTRSVRGLMLAPPSARACYVLAHGAGAGMFHPFMDGAAKGLAERDIATLRYQFPYMERGAKRPDPPELAHATVRAAVTQAARLAPALPLLAGGKSFGGRMTSQAQAHPPSRACAASPSSAFRCIRRDGRRTRVPSIFSRSKCRCCSCKEAATS